MGIISTNTGAYTHCGTRHGWAVKARKVNKLSTTIFLLVERLLALIATILRVVHTNAPTKGYGHLEVPCGHYFYQYRVPAPIETQDTSGTLHLATPTGQPGD